jgi:hypothetical protein
MTTRDPLRRLFKDITLATLAAQAAGLPGAVASAARFEALERRLWAMNTPSQNAPSRTTASSR